MARSKKVFVLIIITFLILFHIPVSANTNINVSSQYAVLIEQSSGRVLFEKGAHEKGESQVSLRL